MKVLAQDYWNVVASDKENVVSEEMMNDASYVAMREISLSYALPSKLFSGKIIRRMNVGIYGRNLFTSSGGKQMASLPKPLPST